MVERSRRIELISLVAMRAGVIVDPR